MIGPPLLGAAAAVKSLRFTLHISVLLRKCVFPLQFCIIENSVLLQAGPTVRAFQNKLLRQWCIHDNCRTVALWYLILNFNVQFAMATEQLEDWNTKPCHFPDWYEHINHSKNSLRC